MENLKYNDEILEQVLLNYKIGDVVISPMTNNQFIVSKIKESWHKKWIMGMDGKFFFDVLWFNGKYAEIVKQ